MAEFARMLHTVLDTTDVRMLAEFYRQLLGLEYRPGDERADDDPTEPLDVFADPAGHPFCIFVA